MSTRAMITLTNNEKLKLNFYRHNDGYPSGALPTLEAFLKRIKVGEIRNDLMQCAGWLILMGRNENGYGDTSDRSYGWKVGAIEPTPYKHGDIQYHYMVNIETLEITYRDGSKKVKVKV